MSLIPIPAHIQDHAKMGVLAGSRKARFLMPSGVADDVQIANAIAEIGTGTIFLGDGTFVFAASVPVPSGITIIGIPPTFVNSSNNNVFDAGRVYSSGTRMLGDGTHTYDCFIGNNVDAGSPTNPGFGNNTLDNIHISNLAIEGFRWPMKFGAVNVMGLYGSSVKNIYGTNNTEALEFHNFVHSEFGELYVMEDATDHNGGIRFVASVASPSILTPGNSRIYQLECLRRKRSHRGIRFEGLPGAQLHALHAYRIEGFAFGDQAITSDATFSAGSPDITVPDGTKFAVDYALTFTATTGAFLGQTGLYHTYFVVSVVGNVIQLSDMMGGTPINATTTGTVTAVLKTAGYPNITWYGHGTTPSGTSNGIINCVVLDIDCECAFGTGGGTLMVIQGAYNLDIDVRTAVGVMDNTLAVTQSSYTTVHANDPNFSTSFKEAQVKYVGHSRGAINWNTGWGTWNGHTTGQQNMSVTPGAAAQIGTGGTVAIYFGTASNLRATMSQGYIKITTGTGTPAAGKLCTLTSQVAKELFLANLFPLDVNALGVMPHIYTTNGTTSFDVMIDSVGLAASTTYIFGYISP